MIDASPELKVVSSNSRGRKRYDQASKRELVLSCLVPGVSIARRAQDSGVHVCLLRKWIAQYLLERERSASEPALAVSQGTDVPDKPEDFDPQARVASEVPRSAFAAVELCRQPRQPTIPQPVRPSICMCDCPMGSNWI
ncbi:transposase [Cupriavidus necator]